MIKKITNGCIYFDSEHNNSVPYIARETTVRHKSSLTLTQLTEPGLCSAEPYGSPRVVLCDVERGKFTPLRLAGIRNQANDL